MKFWNQEMETLPREKMAEFQGAKLRETVQWLHERVPYYKGAIEKSGLKPQDIRSIEDIRALPFTVKNDLRDALRKRISDALNK